MRIAPHVIGIEADRFEQFDNAVLEGLPGSREPVDHERLADDRADCHARVERGVGILKDDLHIAAERAQFAAGQRRRVLALEPDLARGRLDEAQDAASCR